MSKRVLSLLLVMVMTLSMVNLAAAVETQSQPEQAARTVGQPVESEPEQDVQAEAAEEAEAEAEEPLPPASFYVNDAPIYNAELYWLNGVPYAPVRPFFDAAFPGCEIKWENRQAVIRGVAADGTELTVIAEPGKYYIVANGHYYYVPDGVQLINSTTMIPVAILARIFVGGVKIDSEGAVRVATSRKPVAQANYEPATVELLTCLIYAESGNQSMLGKLAVGSVVLNRVDSPLFPNTVYDVIHQKNQFSVVQDGNINLTPSEDAEIAARMCLEGARVTTALFFNVKGLKCWAYYARPYLTTIGDHDFYA